MSEETKNDITQSKYMTIKEESKDRAFIKENYIFFGIISILYAIFYTFCAYQNDAGIMMPILQAGTIYYYITILKKFDRKMKKGSLFYLITILLLGFSIFLTDNWDINALSKIAIFLLFIIFMLHQFYEDTKWTLGKYMEAIAIIFIETLAAIPYPFSDAFKALKERQKTKNSKLKYVLIGILIATPLTFVILSLLLSADLIFANIVMNILNKIFMFKDIYTILTMILFMYITMYCFINAIANHQINEEVKDRRIWEPIIANTFCGILSAVYIMFCSIQIIGLFGARLQLPDGYTYAQYAREGFFQLLFVCGINLVMVLCCMAYFRENKVLKGLLTIISCCTYIMVASSVYRMFLYINVYGLTFLRVFVLWSLFVISILMIGIMIRIYRESFPLFRLFLYVITICYIGLAFSHPDYFIATYNIKKMESKTEKEIMADYHKQYEDLYYITSLSSDAAKALSKYDSKNNSVKEEAVRDYFIDVEQKADRVKIRTFNVSRYVGGSIAKEYLKQ